MSKKTPLSRDKQKQEKEILEDLYGQDFDIAEKKSIKLDEKEVNYCIWYDFSSVILPQVDIVVITITRAYGNILYEVEQKNLLKILGGLAVQQESPIVHYSIESLDSIDTEDSIIYSAYDLLYQKYDWTGGMLEKEIDFFINTLAEYIDSKKIPYNIDVVKGFFYDLRKKDENTYDLQNIAKKCLNVSKEEWGREIFQHMEPAINIGDLNQPLKSLSPDKIKKRLWIKIMPKGLNSEEMTETFIAREEIPGLLYILMIDMEYNYISLSHEIAKQLALSEDELFNLAKDNIKKKALEFIEVDMNGYKVFTIDTQELPVASMITVEDLWKNLIPSGKAFIGVPARSVIWIAPVEKDFSEMKGLLKKLENFNKDIMSNDTHPISPKVFIYEDGSFQPE